MLPIFRPSVALFSGCAVLVLLFITAASLSFAGPFRMAPLIRQNMVLQQQASAPIWGWGNPGTEVRIRPSWGGIERVRVRPDSTWMLTLRTPKAGGPFQLVIEHDDSTLTISNVLVGEVWLCSGQSNMEMTLAGWPPGDTVLNSEDEIAHASSSRIRLFTVERAYSAASESECDGEWLECSPSTVRDFSATAYFFGKKLTGELEVPVGLIHASWGGTPIESWINAIYLSRFARYDATLEKIHTSVAGQHRMIEFLHRYPAIDMGVRKGSDRWKGLNLRDESCARRSYNDDGWGVMRLPTLWESTDLGEFDGVVWFRKRLTVPRDWVGKDLVLSLGPIDDIDVTYVNGAMVGSHEREHEWKEERIYRIPASVVDSTMLQVAVRVVDFQGGGGVYGDPKSMSLRPAQCGDGLSLAGDWKYLPIASYFDKTLFVFGAEGNAYDARPRMSIELSARTLTALYNGMIAPLIPYAIQGVIWYQGEANVGNPDDYKELLPLLIDNWRMDFRSEDMPFFYVQIAPFAYGGRSEYLREAQTASLSVKNTGMVVTLDIGNPQNIHPANKQEVGRRLALLALAKTYHRKIPCSGPTYRSMRKVQDAIELSFDHTENGLVLIGGMAGNGFQIAGADRVFRNATVRVHGNRLLVSHPGISHPESVRYAFTDTPGATLFNTAGLPAPSFRTDVWK